MTLIIAAAFADEILIVTDTAATRPNAPCPDEGGALKACVDHATGSAIAWTGSFDLSPCVLCTPPPSPKPSASVTWDKLRQYWLARLNGHQNVHAPPGDSSTVAIFGFDGPDPRAAFLRCDGAAASWTVADDRVPLPLALGYLEPVGLQSTRAWASINSSWVTEQEFERWAQERIAAGEHWLRKRGLCVVIALPHELHRIMRL